MPLEQVRVYLSRWNRDGDILEINLSTATVTEAADALGVIPARIAKSISLKNQSGAAMLVITAGDMKLDNRKFRDCFGFKARMLDPAEVLQYTGHAVGGVCPFALPPGVDVCLDISMKRFATVFPACGSGNSAIELTPEELEQYSQSHSWVDVCRAITENVQPS